MRCNKCGETLPDDSTFCQFCGSKIEIPTAPAEETPSLSKEEALAKILAAGVVEDQKAIEANKESQPHNELDADFGLVPQKPVYTVGIDEQEKYLKSLRTINGEPIKWNRRGSMSVDGVNGIVDVYDIYLLSGEEYKTIYINLYGAYNSAFVPKGFSFFESTTLVIKEKPKPKIKKQKLQLKKSYLIIGIVIVLGLIIVGLVIGFAINANNLNSNDNKNHDYSNSGSSSSDSSGSSSTTTTSTVSLDKQGGNGGTSSVTVKDKSPMPSATQPTKSGYIFDGYYSEKGGLGSKYYDSNMKSISNWYSSSSPKTLYAYWIKDPDNINKNGITITKDNFENYFIITTEAELVGNNEIIIKYSIKPNSNAYAEDADSSETIYIEIGAEASMLSMYFGEPSYDIREKLTLSKSNNYTASGEMSFKYYVFGDTVYWFTKVAYCSGSIGQ